jgi:hypothetical protein
VYDMYPWNEPDSGANHDQDQTAAVRLPAPRNGAAPRNGTARHANGARQANGARHANGDAAADFTKAIQFALDRRDNGGDAVPASPPATPPTASLTRQ